MSTAVESLDRLEPATLTPVLSRRFALGLRHFAACLLFTLLFLYLNYVPLSHTDLWAHVVYGKTILAQGAIPTADPSMPLAEGMRVTDASWLAQVIFALVERWGGVEWLSNFYALTVLVTSVVLARAFYLATERFGWGLVGTLLVLVIGWSRLSVFGPETLGLLCFAMLLWVLVGAAKRDPDDSGLRSHSRPTVATAGLRWLWLAVPALFALWANLDLSFLFGLTALGCCGVGRIVEVGWHTRSLRAILRDRWVRRWMLLTELALAATLLNPYGIDLLIYSAGIVGNGGVPELLDTNPLVVLGAGGFEFALSWVLLVVVLRHSRQPVQPTEVLLLGAFSLAALLDVRMVAWYASVLVLVLMPHLANVLQRRRETHKEPSPLTAGWTVASVRSFRWSLACLLVVWIGFALSGLSRPVLGGMPRAAEQVHSAATPRGVSAFLREHPPEAQLFNPQSWGDWLEWDGPPGLQLFATSNAHLLPRQVKRDYARIANADLNWPRMLNRYHVATVVVDKEGQPRLAQAIRQERDWRVVYEDSLALIARRAPARPAAKDAPLAAATLSAPNGPAGH